MRPLIALLTVAVALCCLALPASAGTTLAWPADEIWVIKNGTIVHKAPLDSAPRLTVLNRHGEVFVFGCPPQDEQPEDPPQFDFPDDEPEAEPETPEAAPPAGASPIAVALIIAGILGGLYAGYRGRDPVKAVPMDDEEDDMPPDPDTK